VTPEHFQRLCELHDLTFGYSDDAGAYRKGQLELDAIKAAAEQLGREVAIPIWNAEIRRKLQSPWDEAYLWK